METETQQKCAEILEAIVAICNGRNDDETAIAFAGDAWGGNTLTVILTGKGHSHVGIPEGTFPQLIDSLHLLLVEGTGLSFV